MRDAAQTASPLGQAGLFEEATKLVDILFGHDSDGNVNARIHLLTLLDLERRFDAGHALLERVLLNDGHDPALVYALDRLGGEVPAEDFDLVGALLAGYGGNCADQRRLARGVKRIHIGIGGHQIFGRGQSDVLDVLAIDRIEELHPADGLRR